jgi:zinc protease
MVNTAPRMLAVAAVSFAAVAAAQPAFSPGNAGSPAAPGTSVATRFTLPNGLTVLVAERPGVPIVTVRAVVEAGTAFEPAAKAGVANLTALLLTRGSATRSASEADRAIESVGGSLESQGGWDASELLLAVLRKDLALGLDLLADALLRPTFPDHEFERQRQEVLGELRRLDDDPRTVGGRALRRLVFHNHPYGRPVTGTEASLVVITRADVEAFHRAAYRPERAILAVAGDVVAREIRTAIEARFAGWTGSGAAPAAPGGVALGVSAGTETVQRDLSQATILLGQATVTGTHPDFYPLLVANQLLGGGASSRLYTRIREEHGLAYSVSAQYELARYGGHFVVELQCETPRVRQALALLRSELVRLRREQISEEELARAKAYLVGSFPLRMSTAAGVTDLLVVIERYALGLDYPARYRHAITAVTVDDVTRAVRMHWDADRMSLVIVGNLRDAGIGMP